MAGDHLDESLAGLGEFAVIDRLTSGRPQPPLVLLGPGDDAAVVAAVDGRTVVCTDMLVQDRHFRLDWSKPFDVGRKAIAQNAADIEAMGARATAFVVAFGAPGDTATAQAVQLADGMWHEAGLMGAGIVGGDMVAAPQWVISVAALGDLGGLDAVCRSGAKLGDTVAVTGDLGRSAAGFALWRSGMRDNAFGEPVDECDDAPALRRRHLVPEPPYGQGVVAARAGATSMIDVSDGLVADVGHIASASGVRIDLSRSGLRGDVAALAPAAAAVGADPWQWVLGGGEDHALVATFPATLPPGWRSIGTVVDAVVTGDACSPVTLDGDLWDGASGWSSF
ncbi:MAG: thiamine-phosphate kinase [Mycolicibacterium sp.]|uniref:thiamine-phosphate kinase n=1 Tax=Mycolicibacterium sp. TaxID=2320850 RepID=UPI003D0A86A7